MEMYMEMIDLLEIKNWYPLGISLGLRISVNRTKVFLFHKITIFINLSRVEGVVNILVPLLHQAKDDIAARITPVNCLVWRISMELLRSP